MCNHIYLIVSDYLLTQVLLKMLLLLYSDDYCVYTNRRQPGVGTE